MERGAIEVQKSLDDNRHGHKASSEKTDGEKSKKSDQDDLTFQKSYKVAKETLIALRPLFLKF